MSYDFSPNAAPRVEIRTIGRERHPVAVIDGVLNDPRSVVSFASERVRFRRVAPAANFYPGVRAPVPQPYMFALFAGVKGVMHEVFGLPLESGLKADCSFSMVTMQPHELSVLQRLPHFDTVDPTQLAVLHYLCAPELGGTAFYRHCATGYESINVERHARYLEVLNQEIAANPPAPDYYRGDARFESTAVFPAQFDRVIVYRSQLLHAGDIRAACNFSDDPRIGRLTANAFFRTQLAAESKLDPDR